MAHTHTVIEHSFQNLKKVICFFPLKTMRKCSIFLA